MTTLTARPHLLVIWRACLVLAALVLAFASSLVLGVGSGAWWVASCALAAGFLCCWLLYLPARLRRLSLTLGSNNLVVSSGAITRSVRTVPLGSVQFVRVKSSPLHSLLGLRTLEAVCAGGRAEMPGLAPEEAERVAAELTAGSG